MTPSRSKHKEKAPNGAFSTFKPLLQARLEVSLREV